TGPEPRRRRRRPIRTRRRSGACTDPSPTIRTSPAPSGARGDRRWRPPTAVRSGEITSYSRPARWGRDLSLPWVLARTAALRSGSRTGTYTERTLHALARALGTGFRFPDRCFGERALARRLRNGRP